MHRATATAFTGAVARVEHHGRPVWEQAYGFTRADSGALPVLRDTVFDLASLTKLFVGTCALAAVQENAVSLDTPLLDFMPEWRTTPHADITLRMLLAHTSGMNSGADYRELLNEDIARFALLRPLLARPGERVIYSDLGFIALGMLLQRIYGRSLESIVRVQFASRTLGYRPLAALRRSVPATEEDGWRGRVQGVVHDEKAHLLGGTAGHAGLFGAAADAALVGERFLGPLFGRPSELCEAVAREAVTEHGHDSTLRRGLAWALKTSDDNSCGRFFSGASFGHTGFVGTCIWVDPERDLNAVLLTNSLYFGRTDTRDLRAAFYEAVVKDFQDV